MREKLGRKARSKSGTSPCSMQAQQLSLKINGYYSPTVTVTTSSLYCLLVSFCAIDCGQLPPKPMFFLEGTF